ncbi:MAG: EI24 domain-containing protein [Geminicoccaceae bacterium]|nr:EI24 domain-containing protein [Geminicoccaceae bacterium]
MANDLRRALAQTLSPGLRAILWRSLLIALATFVVLLGAAWLLIDRLAVFSAAWLDWLVQLTGFAGALVLAWLFFPAVVSAVIAFFGEEIAAEVEARYYPGLPPAHEPPLWQSAWEGARFTALALALNLLALPFYLFLPGLNLALFIALNGFLLGREYLDVVALRRHGVAEARALRRRLFPRAWTSGALIALFLLVPVVNLVVPAIGIAFMTHRYHRWREKGLTVARRPIAP